MLRGMLRLLVPIVLIVVVIVLVQAVSSGARDVAARRRSRRNVGSGYVWERRREQLSRRAKAVSLPVEDRAGMIEFIETRRGVEAYMEPKTIMQPLSTVLVAEDGEWKRFTLRDDSFIRDLARTRGLPVLDVAKLGYPERMRRYGRGSGDTPSG